MLSKLIIKDSPFFSENFELELERVNVFISANGMGKTTLLKLIKTQSKATYAQLNHTNQIILKHADTYNSLQS